MPINLKTDKMDNFIKRWKLTQEEIELVMTGLLTKKRLGPDDVTGESPQISKEEILILWQLRKSRRKQHFPISSMKLILSWWQIQQRNHRKKKKTTTDQYSSYTWVRNSLTSINTSNQQCIQRMIHHCHVKFLPAKTHEHTGCLPSPFLLNIAEIIKQNLTPEDVETLVPSALLGEMRNGPATL